jgi:hypothetical protein
MSVPLASSLLSIESFLVDSPAPYYDGEEEAGG